MKITLRHAGTGHFRFVDTGWSWSLFLSSGFLGLPLFFRGLALWGTFMLVAWSLCFVAPLVAGGGENTENLEWVLSIIMLSLCAFFGFRGNALSAKRYFSLGYEFADPDGVKERAAAQSWGL